jgi:hypothetical protein
MTVPCRAGCAAPVAEAALLAGFVDALRELNVTLIAARQPSSSMLTIATKIRPHLPSQHHPPQPLQSVA